ncbi:MAG: hypothetical protein HOI23_15535 [Deltaproteobacteria bacterium]|jgi:type IV/VI secretion system ImpK/VasF family protein|nr:hypothetical protein [Deltaproteobacteria bacterium]MBT6432084.1 hypothetical protein [Deltaproteobacteria bacterium]MBT6491953.1 hypothetical protein [Deltaproteobacteria bacterium]
MTELMVNQESQPLWTNIRAAFIAAMNLCEEAQVKQELFEAKQEELDPLTGAVGAGQSFHAEADVGGADMVALRASLRKTLDSLKKNLTHELSEREVYFCLFPLVIYIDEVVQLKLTTLARPWQPLQRELYKIDNGGERFYEGIDNLLSKSDTPSVIFEVFYFCLSHGFRGRYVSDAEKIKLYGSMLRQRIPTRHLVSGDPDKKLPVARISLVSFPRRLYAGALSAGAFAVCCGYLFSYLELHL